VREAVEDYLADYTARGGRALRDIEWTFNAHVLPDLGDQPVASLTTADLSTWHRALAEAPARLRSKALATERRVREVAENDAEGRRARRSTANGVLTLLKAALNHAFRMGRVADDTAWRRVRPFQKVSAARVRYLTDDEARRLATCCPPDLQALVTAALLTGARYNELASLRMADFDDENGTVHVAASKGGKARHIALTDEGREFFRRAAVGRAADVVLLPRGDGRRWNKSEQFRPMREACAVARIAPAASFHVLRHTYASRLAMRGVPMAVIAAQLGHADLRITMRHYAHLAPSYVADTVRAAFGSLDLSRLPDAVVNLDLARAGTRARTSREPRSSA
jgi:integrase